MTASRLAPSSDLLEPAGLRAETTATYLRLVASQHGRLPAELARVLSREQLEAESAQTLLSLAQSRARQLHDDGADPPDGADLFSRVVRGTMARLAAEDDERADRHLSALID